MLQFLNFQLRSKVSTMLTEAARDYNEKQSARDLMVHVQTRVRHPEFVGCRLLEATMLSCRTVIVSALDECIDIMYGPRAYISGTVQFGVFRISVLVC